MKQKRQRLMEIKRCKQISDNTVELDEKLKSLLDSTEIHATPKQNSPTVELLPVSHPHADSIITPITIRSTSATKRFAVLRLL